MPVSTADTGEAKEVALALAGAVPLDVNLKLFAAAPDGARIANDPRIGGANYRT